MRRKLIALALGLGMTLTACGTTTPELPTEPAHPTPALPVSAVLALDLDHSVSDAVHPQEQPTLQGEAVFTEGVSGEGLYLSPGSFLELPGVPQRLSGQLTASFWLLSQTPMEGNTCLAWFFAGSSQTGSGWSLTSPNDHTPLELTLGTSGGKPVKLFLSGSRSTFFPQGEWVHIALVCDPQKGIAAVYRNGMLQEQLSLPQDISLNPGEGVCGYLGDPRNESSGRLALDEVQLHNAALTDRQLLELYTAFGAVFDGAQVVEADCRELVFSMRHLRQDISLPTRGKFGSTITWHSQREELLSSEGFVTRPDSGQADETVTLTATVEYAGVTREKSFVFTVEALPEFTDFASFPPGAVQLQDLYEANTLKLALDRLNALQADRLLWDYHKNDQCLPYGAPEDAAGRTATLGHMLTALSQSWVATRQEAAGQQLSYILQQLKACQDPSTGYLAPFPEEVFARLEAGDTRENHWHPLSRLMAGLLDAWELTGDETALDIASAMGLWVYSRTRTWTAEVQTRVLSTQCAGMNEALYRLYRHTGNEEHLSAAHSFDDMSLLDSLVAGEDVLAGRNVADTTAQLLGAARRYDLTREEFYLRAAENYWDMAVDHHSYITGGLGAGGLFGKPQQLNADRGTENCDLCGTWQMLRLTQLLLRLTGDSKYADYHETTYLNALLPAQDPQTGRISACQSMICGVANSYLDSQQLLHCCAGTALEAFTAIAESVYMTQGNTLYILRYVPSQVEHEGLTLTQQTNMPLENVVRLRISGTSEAALALHIPQWCAGTPAVWINSQQAQVTVNNGFVYLPGPWKNGDIIELALPMQLQVHTLPGTDNVIAFRYGPMVLSAELGTEGVHPDPGPSTLTVTQGTAQQWLETADRWLGLEKGYPRLILQGTDQMLQFSPYFLLNPQRFGIYYTITDLQSP